MTYTVSIYFMGQYRPAYFERGSLKEAIQAALRASINMRHAPTVSAWLWAAERALSAQNCSAYSRENGTVGVSARIGSHDPFLDSVTRDIPECWGLDYSQAINAQAETGR